FLDLFSGSGILGVEAASRGAAPVVLVEKDPGKRATIHRNISFVTSPIELVVAPVERFLRSDRRRWDIVFLDPPFDAEGKGALLDQIAAGDHVAPDGLLLLHVHRAEGLEADRPHLVLDDRRSYGQSTLLFFRPRKPPVA
ncbi:MAG TPA: RsmD family RNA methyltransferase, partial [Spirochaetia bacterium]|nr:RsmD family RNA methyltransferase [Spirochaetia bacterium]